LAELGQLESFDILFVIDQSESTSDASGADVDGNGERDRGACRAGPRIFSLFSALGRSCRGPNDSIFAAELAAVRTLLGQLDPRTTQVGLVSFSGDGNPLSPDAAVITPLTLEYKRVER